MRKTTLLAVAATALTLGASGASAQAWMTMVERQAVLDDRIEARLRSGGLSPDEARELRAGMDGLVALEAQYGFGGLSDEEKQDLDRRYAIIDDRLRAAPPAPEFGDRWVSIEDRKLQLDARIERDVRDGRLSRAEARELRQDFDAIARIEADYQVDGLSATERADLNRRFDELAARIHAARSDDDRE